MMDLVTSLKDAGAYAEQEFGLAIERTRMTIYDGEQWSVFCDANRGTVVHSPDNPSGLYLPEHLRAYVDGDHPTAIANANHELFGHGLFYENSTYGQEMVELAKAGRLTEILGERTEKGVVGVNIGNFEGFATWLEAILCQETGNAAIWEQKRKDLEVGHKQYLELHELFLAAERRLGRNGLMQVMGFNKSS